MIPTPQNPPSDPRVWPVVFIEPDPAQAPRKARHPLRWVFITVLLGMVLPVVSWFAGRMSAPAREAIVLTPPQHDAPGHTVAALTPPPRRYTPSTPPAEPTDSAATFANDDPPPASAPPSRPRRVVPQTSSVHRPPALAHLSISSYPWGLVTIDDDRVGNTPMVSLPILPGLHRVRIERAGYVAFDRVVRMAPGEAVQLTGIVLQVPTP